jgi:hypothetical protein
MSARIVTCRLLPLLPAGRGLLGMSFLGGLKYTSDFQKQTLN